MNIIQMRTDIKISMHVLLIVDMQPTWSTSNDPELQKNIQALISWSMYHGCPIIFLEYRPSGKLSTEWNTHESLIKLPRNEGYDRYKVIPKGKSNGSFEVIDACRNAGYPMNHLLVAGVDADCCVMRTVAGIAKKKPEAQISVIRNACRASSEKVHNDETSWNQFQTISSKVSLCTAVTPTP